MNQLANGQQAVSLEPGSDMAFALIIDGKSLAYALEDDMKERFLQLAVKCASVICCRGTILSSPTNCIFSRHKIRFLISQVSS